MEKVAIDVGGGREFPNWKSITTKLQMKPSSTEVTFDIDSFDDFPPL